MKDQGLGHLIDRHVCPSISEARSLKLKNQTDWCLQRLLSLFTDDIFSLVFPGSFFCAFLSSSSSCKELYCVRLQLILKTSTKLLL